MTKERKMLRSVLSVPIVDIEEKRLRRKQRKVKEEHCERIRKVHGW